MSGTPSLTSSAITQPAAACAVSGRIFTAQGVGAGGLRVEAVDKNVGADVSLAQGTTDTSGNYSLQFPSVKVTSQGKTAPDVQVLIFVGKTFLGASEVRYNAQANETIDVHLPATASAALPSEYESLTAALAFYFKGNLRDLKENDGQQDVTFLAHKSGWDARMVAMASLADRFSQASDGTTAVASDIQPAFFYALFRAGLSTNPDTLYRAGLESATHIWNQAIAQRVIPKTLESEIPRAQQAFHMLSAQKVLTGPPMAGVSSVSEMLAVSGLNDEAQKSFANLHAKNNGNNLEAFWKKVGDALGSDTTSRLQVDSKLGALTVNNAPLLQKLHVTLGGAMSPSVPVSAGDGRISDPLQLAFSGFHRAPKWRALLDEKIPIPPEIQGETPDARRDNYARHLAAQVRLSYPTASVAEMVKSGDLLPDKVPSSVRDKVYDFLAAHQDRFVIGAQPVQQYIAQKNLHAAVDDESMKQIKNIQRVYAITPNDNAMAGLLKRGVDAAYHVVRYHKQAFVQSFASDLGGADVAQQVYDRARQVHNAVLNLAVSYLTARNAPPLGAAPLPAKTQQKDAHAQLTALHAPVTADSAGIGTVLQPFSKPQVTSSVDAIAPTLEELFGSMDFSAGDEYRNLLSPAAYLVDLLHFIDDGTTGSNNPQTVLFNRRPDIPNLPLTSENTNTPLPYIDLVNETLEYYVANNALTGYKGHDTGDTATADLLASPQFVTQAAYDTLQQAYFPLKVPFHQPLEKLRRYFENFGVSLPQAMERLRKSEIVDVDRHTGSVPPTEYGWRDILMEELRLSRDEYAILTDSGKVSLKAMYGSDETDQGDDGGGGSGGGTGHPGGGGGGTGGGTHKQAVHVGGSGGGSDDKLVIEALSNAKELARRLDISYDDLVAILKTRFVNPNADLIPKLERLGVSFSTVQRVWDPNFAPQVPQDIDLAEYDHDPLGWLQRNFLRLREIIVLVDVNTAQKDPGEKEDFANLELQYTMAPSGANFRNLQKDDFRTQGSDFVQILRFVRLWRKTGWSIEQTDAAICALLSKPPEAIKDAKEKEVDDALVEVVSRLAVVVRVMRILNLSPDRDLLSLLACWSDISTHGEQALYRQMFLNRAMLGRDPIFADNGYGEFLVDSTQKMADHAEALRAAFNLTGDEYNQILAALSNSDASLTLSNISAVYRRAWLARKLRLSVRELLLLVSQSGLDPFAPLDMAKTSPPELPVLRFLALVKSLKDGPINTAQALYLIWNLDLNGKSTPDPAQVIDLAHTLRGDFSGIEDQFAIVAGSSEDAARARVALVYGQETADAFFALLDDTVRVDVPWTMSVAVLDSKITAADAAISYDDANQELSYSGVMSEAQRDALKQIAADVLKPASASTFQSAVDVLFSLSQAQDNTKKSTVSYTCPPALDSKISTTDPNISYDSRSHRLAHTGMLTSTAQKALKNVSGVATGFSDAVDQLAARCGAVKDAFFSPYPNDLLPIYNAADRPAALEALVTQLPQLRKRQQAIQRLGIAASVDPSFVKAILDSPNAPYPLHAAKNSGQPALNDVLALDAPPTSITLGSWSGYLEAPETGFYNIVIEAESKAVVSLQLDGSPEAFSQSGTVWRNSAAIPLKAGALYQINLSAKAFPGVDPGGKGGSGGKQPGQPGPVAVTVKWQTPSRPLEVIPPRYLYPAGVIASFGDLYVRLLKIVTLASALGLTGNEVAYFTTHPDNQISGHGWLNALPIRGPSGNPRALLQPFHALLDFARLKADLSPGDERLLTVLRDPTASAQPTATSDGPLFVVTRWNSKSLEALLNRFGIGISNQTDQHHLDNLNHWDVFRRVYDAFALTKTMGVSAAALINAATNYPDPTIVGALQSALGARYDAAAWRDVIRPINDQMRALQRDALVAYIIHQLQAGGEKIDTPDKLFQYFLMDIEMDPCMQTSRVRHALSSVQLFIDCCLMNLEPDATPFSADQVEQWEWMKRYRVWEANRKVFLFPEDWLEPELRGNKSPFFRELESALLQNDITEESATEAMLNYLSKLEEVAKLEPCAIYHDEDAAVGHVIARTTGAHRKYFYRRYDYRADNWTSWEQIQLDIPDNPVAPVVWKGRLLLFWLKIIKKSAGGDTLSGNPNAKLSDLNNSQISAVLPDPQITVQVLLCWSEYYNGKWQPAKTSDPLAPATLFSGSESDPAAQTSIISTDLAADGHLVVNVTYNNAGKAFSKKLTFSFHNTHGLPYVDSSPPTVLKQPYLRLVSSMPLYSQDNADYVQVSYYDSGSPGDQGNIPSSDRTVLNHSYHITRIVEPQHFMQQPFLAPFLCEDQHNTYFVTSNVTQASMAGLRSVSKFGVAPDPGGVQVGKIQSPLEGNRTIVFGDRIIGPQGAISDGVSASKRRQ